MSRRAVAAKSEHHLLRKALLFPAQRTQEIVKNVTKAGTTQLEVAIKTLSSAFATPRQHSKSSSDNNDIGSSRHVRRGSGSSMVSDITLPSTFDFTSDVVTSAEEIVMNARRKQAILIGIMIKLQAQWRVQLAKQELSDRQRYGTRQERSASSPSFYETRRRIRAVVRVQAWLRRSRIRWNFLRNRYAATCIQKNIRCNRIRLGYLLLIGVITRFQAVIKGRQIRKGVFSSINDRMIVYRSQLFALWKTTHTPLSYRTKYWTTIRNDSIFCLSLAERELNRIWSSLKMALPLEAPNQSHVPTTTLALSDPFGLADASFRKAMKVSRFVLSFVFISLLPYSFSIMFSYTQSSQFSEVIANGMVKLPSGRFRLNGRASKVATGAERVEAERLQIYEKISLPNVAEAIEEYYDLFSISKKNKHRKQALAESICKFMFYISIHLSSLITAEHIGF